MTDLMNVSELRAMAARDRRTAEPKKVLTMRWAIDEANGRAVIEWVEVEEQAPWLASEQG